MPCFNAIGALALGTVPDQVSGTAAQSLGIGQSATAQVIVSGANDDATEDARLLRVKIFYNIQVGNDT